MKAIAVCMGPTLLFSWLTWLQACFRTSFCRTFVNANSSVSTPTIFGSSYSPKPICLRLLCQSGFDDSYVYSWYNKCIHCIIRNMQGSLVWHLQIFEYRQYRGFSRRLCCQSVTCMTWKVSFPSQLESRMSVLSAAKWTKRPETRSDDWMSLFVGSIDCNEAWAIEMSICKRFLLLMIWPALWKSSTIA